MADAMLGAVNAGDNNTGQRLSSLLLGHVEQIQFVQQGYGVGGSQRRDHHVITERS